MPKTTKKVTETAIKPFIIILIFELISLSITIFVVFVDN